VTRQAPGPTRAAPIVTGRKRSMRAACVRACEESASVRNAPPPASASERCLALGACKPANAPATCTAYADLPCPDGGTADSGPAAADGGGAEAGGSAGDSGVTPPGGGGSGCGCAAAGTRPPLALLGAALAGVLLLGRPRRRRR
jgi:MYXO-CTERM domain-containing protein